MRPSTLPLLVAGALAAACGGSPSDPSHGVDASGVDSLSTSGPTFLSFGTNVTTLNVSDSLTVSAVLTSPANNALVGGTLNDETGAIQYGAFSSGTEKGSFSLTITWEQINQTRPLTFEATDHRTFVAQFFAADGAKASKSVDIAFTCNEESACSGQCFDLKTDENNCGTCGNACQASSTSSASFRGCQTSTCVYNVEPSTFASCASVCANVSMTCTPSCTTTDDSGHPATYALAYYGNGHNTYSASCSDAPPAGGGFELCCCR